MRSKPMKSFYFINIRRSEDKQLLETCKEKLLTKEEKELGRTITTIEALRRAMMKALTK
jgi:hypothetical protein